MTLEGPATASPTYRVLLQALSASYHSALQIVRARRTAAITLALPAMIAFGPTATAGEPDSDDAGVTSLPVVLGIRRDADMDRWVATDGLTHDGRVLDESFRLLTSHGDLVLPARLLAAIDLTRQLEGIHSIVTAAGDRLTGLLLETHFRLQKTDANSVEVVRRETITRILFRLPPQETINFVPDSFVLLRNGDFVSGRVRPNQLQIRQSASEPREIALGPDVSMIFSDLPGGLVRVESPHAEPWEGTMAPLDLHVDLAVGLSLPIYSDHIESIRPWTGLPLDLARRIGVPTTPANRPSGPTDMIRPGLVWIPPGEFFLGSPNEEKDRELDEGPLTRVTIADGFWIAAHEVTQLDYESLMGRNPSQYTGDLHRPVEKVNWQEAVDYCRALNAHELAAGRVPDGYAFRLPTEAEWEYACRAGTTTRFSHGDDPGYLETPGYAWCGHNSNSSTHPVGTRKPNPWGLFDMHGNVWEWCSDAWTGAYPGGTITNGAAAPGGSLRVARGGSWLYDPRFCRSANRDSYGMLNRCSDVGFRVVLALIR